jgi:acetyl esterase/lipase
MTTVTFMFIFAAANTLVSQVSGVPVIPLLENQQESEIKEDGLNAPLLHLFLIENGTTPGPAVIVCPGGGYQGLAMDYEGVDVARWLNSHGIAAFVLEYRVSPNRHPIPLQDAQKALRVVRSRAGEWHVDPSRLGMLGFSAGGHLVSTAATHFDKGDPASKDVISQMSCRPDFTILIYPVISLMPSFGHLGSRDNLLGPNPPPSLAPSLSNDQQVTSDTPPAFLVHSTGDTGVSSENSVSYYMALLKAGVPAEMHIYEQGEHGYGMGKGDPALSTWPDLCIKWMVKRGILDEK